MTPSGETPDLVSVVIPAYNAADTVGATLQSVQAQTHAELEILVVDDGSTDGTSAIVEDFAVHDDRIRLIHQANAGVAAARNNGWRQARSDLIAFVDADDLWSPDKIERQLAALLDGGHKVGLVYSWYVMIDAHDRITYRGEGPRHCGEVLPLLIANNFIGNGSAALVRRDALEAANGFEPALRANDAQGCEDILFYCRVAEHFEFAVVADYQIGYRQLPDAMSANLPRMLRSWFMVLDEMGGRHPDQKAALRQGRDSYCRWVFRRALHRRNPLEALRLAGMIAQRSPVLAARLLGVEAPATIYEMVRWRLKRPVQLERHHPPQPEQSRAVGSLFTA